MTSVLAVDLGAESGRVTRVDYDGERVALGPSERFLNTPVDALGVLHWDAFGIWRALLDGIRAVAAADGPRASAIGADAFGLDFALLDGHGRMLAHPVHHRDRRRLRGLALAEERVGRAALHRATGTAVMPVNGLFELVAMAADGDAALAAADRIVMVADLLHLWLSGTVAGEWTLASTLGATTPDGGWATELVERLGIPSRIFGDVIPPGTRLGELRRDVSEATGAGRLSVIAPGSHDTASAVAAVPFADPDAAYISSGTWSLVGVETRAPVVSDVTLATGLSNEGGVAGRNRLITNVVGLWLVQECRRQWAREGAAHSYEQLVALAAEAPALRSVIALDDPDLLPPGDMPARLRRLCERAGEPVPESPGAVMRCALESLALAYRRVFRDLERATGRRIGAVHVTGGGARNALLCQWTADASARPVLAGPIEATTLGNALAQLIALGELGGLDDARAVVARSAAIERYEPRGGGAWDAAAERVERPRAAALAS